MARCNAVIDSGMAAKSLTLTDITIDRKPDGASASLRGVLGVPAGDGPWPAVVVVHEAFGVDTEMRKQVAHLASLGYLAVMPDLYSDGGARRCLVATMKAMRSGTGRAYLDIEAARQWVQTRPESTGAVGVIGFCMGGGFALMTASSGFAAAASNYGMLPRDPDDALGDACPVIASYGANDSSLRGAAATLEETLTRHDVVHDVKEYADAGHTFMNEAPAGPAWFRPLARVMKMSPNPDAAADAWERIDAFFREHLQPPHP
jgi:carboxymethylenebutenolidase